MGLRNAFFEINIGYINYPFSNSHVYSGFAADRIVIPHTAVRIIPFGYNLNDYLSLQISYMRPVNWVRYENVNNDNKDHVVFMNVGGFTLKGQYPVLGKIWLFGEGGLGVITRSGFKSNLYPFDQVMEEANYATFLFGAGVKYKLNKNWDLQFTAAYSPANSKNNQPYTVFYGGGFAFNMYELPEEKVNKNKSDRFVFPRNMIQVGYTTNALGYGVNNFVSEGKIPVFWGGKAEVQDGITIHYQRNAFHTLKIFSLDWGASFSHYTSKLNKQQFVALSLFPVFRFTPIHSKYVDLYFNYSVAGPSYISGLEIDGRHTGPEFTFQDFMGMGFYFGKNRKTNVEFRIAHYSNGNIFPDNDGVKIPLTFNLGYTF
ncbi:MAG: hypothetical protein C0594_06205 [Marinilabiliales bacterium]|nr:MAG: hypothetical protein C0594_06205 [Marinilabiliales bacterium]